MANRTTGADRRPDDAVKADIIRALSDGMLVHEALSLVNRGQSWWSDQRKRDKVFAQRVDRIRRLVHDNEHHLAVPDYPTFCEEYLGHVLWDHQLNMLDVLEGRTPRALHPAMTYAPGAAGAGRILINIPPNHAKTISVSVDWVTWRLLQDKDLSVLIISKTQGFAAKILWAIKQRLTAPRYAELQLAFGPVGGFRATADQWSQTQIYLWGNERNSGSKDPTVEAVGIGGQVYGNRAKLVIIDDAIVLSNAGQWEFQQDWIRQEVASRIGPDDQLVVVGTRVAPVDLYRELQNPDHYHDGVVPWTYLGMPAVLEYADKPKDWITLWPLSDQPFTDTDRTVDGMNYPRWTGERMSRVRNEVGPRRWSLVYQQQDIPEEGTFDPQCVRGSVDPMRPPGPLLPGQYDVPMTASLYVICSMDPAVAGNTAAVAYAVDKLTGRRWIMDVQVVRGPTPAQIRQLIERMTERYHPNEWVIEANAFQLALVQDETINRYLASRGVVMRPHYTVGQGVRAKKDEQYGVSSMSVLLGTMTRAGTGTKMTHQGDNLVSFPVASSPGMKKLIDELVGWSPDMTKVQRLGRDDAIMAWWFAELRAREVVNIAKRTGYAGQRNSFLSKRDLRRRYSVSLSDAARVRDADESTVFM